MHVIYLYVVCIVSLQVRAGHTDEHLSSSTSMRLRRVSELFMSVVFLLLSCCLCIQGASVKAHHDEKLQFLSSNLNFLYEIFHKYLQGLSAYIAKIS